MRGVPAWQKPHSVQHPSSVSALRADPPSPTRGEGKAAAPLTPFPPPLPPTETTAPLPTCRATA
ncbi:MAG: hypothetical protein EOR92_28170 [Mesorhizobium sp.]|nr:MAG: hypothetical protein EOR02_26625 [Mesorhizobium sp.]RWQ13906.1 MAG: hypothetical protein EOR92_28170 [Mesorhizobium sp.]